MRYVAIKNKCGVCLSRDSQLDTFLSKGFDIVAIDENGEENILATNGEWLTEKPQLEKSTTIRISGIEVQ